jgi:putative nucleotidyltransferase with HDIG domain
LSDRVAIHKPMGKSMPTDALRSRNGGSQQEFPVAALAENELQVARHLQRRDRNILLLYGLSGFVVVGLAERLGMAPLLARGIVYLLLTTALWAVLLRANRRLVGNLMRDKQAGYESLLLAYDKALGLKDAYSGGHGRRVALYANRIAGAMGLPQAEANAVREAALLHDIGKIGVADAILTKPGELTAEEFNAIRQHPVRGAEIVEAIPLLSHHAPAVRHHHERFDGSGYPAGLAGHDIPLAARIIAVADVLDALTSDRSYRGSLPLDAAVAEIGRAAGKQFDPEIVGVISSEAFLHDLNVMPTDNPSTRNQRRT